MARWSATTVVIVTLRDYQAVQIHALHLISFVIQATLVVLRPFDTFKGNAVALFNEFTVSLYLYLLLSLANRC